MDTQQTKSCTNPKCEQVNPQPVTEFYLNRGRGDGYNSHCKSCWRRYLEANREKRRRKQEEYNHTHREYTRKYGQDNRESIIKKKRNRYKANPELQKERTRLWRENNPEKDKERTRRYRENHPNMLVMAAQNRRARTIGNGGTYTQAEWEALCKQYDYLCLCCKEQNPLTVDHVIPISKGGSNSIDNLQPLCRGCNSRKGTRVIDYRPDSPPT